MTTVIKAPCNRSINMNGRTMSTLSESITVPQRTTATTYATRVGIVIPTLNSYRALSVALPLVARSVPDAVLFGIDDLSTDKTIELLKEYGAVIPFRFKKEGYGKSLVEGLTKAYYEYGCDVVIEMDADHPIEPLQDFIEGVAVKGFDVVIGVESGKRPSRSIAMFLVKRFLGLKKFRHPTCGYIAFSRKALKEIFETKPRVKCNNDFVHIQILFKAYKICEGLRFGEMEFDGSAHPKHRMSIKRIIRWLWSFSSLLTKRLVVLPFLVIKIPYYIIKYGAFKHDDRN